MAVFLLLVVILITAVLSLLFFLRSAGPFKSPVKALIVLGSGGHTSEMFKLIEDMDIGGSYKPVNFLVATDDILSQTRFKECNLVSKGSQLIAIRRSRQVGQSYVTSVVTTLLAAFDSLLVYVHHQPDLIICNGPGTCIPLCIIAKLWPFKRTAVMFVESFCRTESLSLSGQILYFIADHFLVQWPFLAEKYPRTKYIGLLV